MTSRRVSVRSRSVVPFLAAALAASLLAVPRRTRLGRRAGRRARSGAPVPGAPINPKTPKAVFFAADGLRQDLIPKYTGFFSTMNLMLRFGTSASGDGLLTQAPPNTGAGWYSLATGAWPGVHGSTNNTFHINGQPFGTDRTAAFDSERAAGRVDRAGRRAWRPEGRAGGVGRWAQRVDRRPDDRLPLVPVGPRRDHELHRRRRVSRCSTTTRSSGRSGCSSIIPLGYAGQAAVRRRGADAGDRAGRVRCRSRSARRWRCGCACSTSATTSTA